MLGYVHELSYKPTICSSPSSGADPGFEEGGFNLVPNSDTGGATNDDF